MQYLCTVTQRVLTLLTAFHAWLPALLFRLVLAWEFGEAGWEKWHGHNWFSELSFPFPFNLLSAELNWNMAMGFELIGALMLVLGVFTRFFSLSLVAVTMVAIASVHWPEHWGSLSELWMGYRFEDTDGDGFGNYKLPLLYLLMLLPLITGGAGRVSVDHYWARGSVK